MPGANRAPRRTRNRGKGTPRVPLGGTVTGMCQPYAARTSLAQHGMVGTPHGGPTLDALARIFGVPKPVIAMVHLPALPGRPLHDRAAGIAAAVDSVRRDLDALQSAGVDGLL